MSRRVWVEGMMQWRRQKASGGWIEDNPPLPKWAKESNGFVPASRFVRLWAAVDSLSALKQELFWLSLEDIESQAMLLSDWLVDSGYQQLPPKLLWSQAPLSEAELAELVADGLVALAETVEAPVVEEAPVAQEAPVAAAPAEPVAPAKPETPSDLTPQPARPNEDPDRDFVPFALKHPSDSVGIGIVKMNKA